MSIAREQLEAQRPRAEIIPHAPTTLDFTSAIIVNRQQLTEAHREAHHVSRVLHNIENLNDLNWDEMTDLCCTAYRAAQLLTAMLDRKADDAG